MHSTIASVCVSAFLLLFIYGMSNFDKDDFDTTPEYSNILKIPIVQASPNQSLENYIASKALELLSVLLPGIAYGMISHRLAWHQAILTLSLIAATYAVYIVTLMLLSTNLQSGEPFVLPFGFTLIGTILGLGIGQISKRR